VAVEMPLLMLLTISHIALLCLYITVLFSPYCHLDTNIFVLFICIRRLFFQFSTLLLEFLCSFSISMVSVVVFLYCFFENILVFCHRHWRTLC